MSEAERYQRLRSHLAFLRLPTATEALPEVLDQARAEGWGLLATLERLLAAEVGAVRWRDPDADLPADFDVHRDTHYQRLRQPLDPAEFIDTLRGELTDALRDLDSAIGRGDTGGVSFGRRAGQPWISVPKLERQPEPVKVPAACRGTAAGRGVLCRPAPA